MIHVPGSLTKDAMVDTISAKVPRDLARNHVYGGKVRFFNLLYDTI